MMHARSRLAKRVLGFTLMEILIVLLIGSIVTAVAMLTISRNQQKDIETFTKELAQLVQLAQEQALMQPEVLGLYFSQNYFQFSRLQTSIPASQQQAAALFQQNKWVPLTDSVFKARDIPSNIQMTVNVGQGPISLEEATKQTPQIIFSVNGEVTPFTIYVGKKDEKPLYVITGDQDGEVKTQEVP